MSAEKHKEQIKGGASDEESNSDSNGSLSILPSKRKLLLGGAIVLVGVVAYKMLFDGDEDVDDGEDGTEIDIDGESLEDRLRGLDDNEVNVEDPGVEEEKSFEEAQKEAADELHEDTPEFEGGE